MPSVLGPLEAREKRVREWAARLREEAERVQVALTVAEGAPKAAGEDFAGAVGVAGPGLVLGLRAGD